MFLGRKTVRSVAPKGARGVGTGRATRGDQAGEKCQGRDRGGDGKNRRHCRRADADGQVLQERAREKRRAESQRQPDCRQPRTLSQNQSCDASGIGAHRKANGKLTGAGGGQVRDHRVGPGASQRDRDRGKGGNQPQVQRESAKRLVNDPIERLDVEDRESWIDLLHDRADGVDDRLADVLVS